MVIKSKDDILISCKSPREATRTCLSAEKSHGENEDDRAQHGGRGVRVVGGLLEDAYNRISSIGSNRKYLIDIRYGVQNCQNICKPSNSINNNGPDHDTWDVDGSIVTFFRHMDHSIHTS